MWLVTLAVYAFAALWLSTLVGFAVSIMTRPRG